MDCVGFEAKGHGAGAAEAPATVLNAIMTVARAGATLGIPGLYVTGDPGGIDEEAKVGSLKVRLGLGWAKSHSFTTGQCPVMSYNRQLMMAILHDKAHIADAVNATVIPLDKAPDGYRDFDSGVAAEVRDRPARPDSGLTPGRRTPGKVQPASPRRSAARTGADDSLRTGRPAPRLGAPSSRPSAPARPAPAAADVAVPGAGCHSFDPCLPCW